MKTTLILARILAAGSSVAWLFGVMRWTAAVSATSGRPPDAASTACALVHLASAAIVVWTAGRRNLAGVWIPIGVSWGFLVLALWVGARACSSSGPRCSC